MHGKNIHTSAFEGPEYILICFPNQLVETAMRNDAWKTMILFSVKQLKSQIKFKFSENPAMGKHKPTNTDSRKISERAEDLLVTDFHNAITVVQNPKVCDNNLSVRR